MAKRIALKDHISVDAVDLSQLRPLPSSSRASTSGSTCPASTHRRERVPGRPDRAGSHRRVLRLLRRHRSPPDPVPDPREPGGRRVRVAARPDRRRLGHQPAARRERAAAHLLAVARPAARRRRGRPRSSPPTRPGSPTSPVARETVAVRGLTSLIRDFKTLDQPVEPGAAERAPGRRRRRQARRPDHGSARSTRAQRPASKPGSGSAASPSNSRSGKPPASIRSGASLQMRKALLPALMSNEDDMERQLERAMDRISREFERRG